MQFKIKHYYILKKQFQIQKKKKKKKNVKLLCNPWPTPVADPISWLDIILISWWQRNWVLIP